MATIANMVTKCPRSRPHAGNPKAMPAILEHKSKGRKGARLNLSFHFFSHNARFPLPLFPYSNLGQHAELPRASGGLIVLVSPAVQESAATPDK